MRLVEVVGLLAYALVHGAARHVEEIPGLQRHLSDPASFFSLRARATHLFKGKVRKSYM